MTVHLARDTGSVWNNTPLTWRPVLRSDFDPRKYSNPEVDYRGQPFTAAVVCANGHSGVIDKHDITEDGGVKPSIVCTQDNCTWHEYVILDGWTEHGN